MTTIMKLNIKNISAALLITVLASCSLDREPLTGPSTSSFPASAEEAESGLLAAYKALPNNIMQYEPGPNRWLDQLTDIGATRTALSNWPDFTLPQSCLHMVTWKTSMPASTEG